MLAHAMPKNSLVILSVFDWMNIDHCINLDVFARMSLKELFLKERGPNTLMRGWKMY